MKQVLIPVADGTEEIEAVTLIDVLRRAGAKVTVASVMPGRTTIVAARGVKIEADMDIRDTVQSDWDLIALPGGMPGAEHLQKSSTLLTLIRRQMDASGWMAAICAAPAVVLGKHNLIAEYRATCFPAFQDELQPHVKQLSQDSVVVDRNLVTSQGPATAMAMGIQLTACLFGEEKASQVAEALLFKR